MKSKEYKSALKELQIELVKLQRDVIANGRKLLLIIEGRDGAGKDGAIKAITQHMSPRETRTVALGAPSDRDQTLWYFQRFVPYLPAAGETVLFNRSWYNRAGVERVMGFCTDDQYERFMKQVCEFEEMLIESGIQLFKFYLDISREEQEERLQDRVENPLKNWKLSPIDAVAAQHWNDYSNARNAMFLRTDHPLGPWLVVKANNKRRVRLNLIRYVLQRVEYQGKNGQIAVPDTAIVFGYDEDHLASGDIEP